MPDRAARPVTPSDYPAAAVLDQVSDCVVVVDGAGRLTYANPAARAHGLADLPPELRQLAALATLQASAAESVSAGWWRRATPMADGGLAIIARPVPAPASALPRADTRLHELFQHAPIDMMVLRVGADGGVTVEQANTAFGRATGLQAEAMAGCPIGTHLAPATAGVIAADARTCVAEGAFECQHALIFPVGERQVRSHYRLIPGDQGGPPLVLLTQLDLTESRRIEAALRQALRLEVIGQLTGGVAHDFNNLLTAILGSLELLGRAVTEDRHRRWLKVASDAAHRGATLTQQLLSYARKQFMAPTATDIPRAMASMTELIRGSLGSRIVLQTCFAAETWLAHTDIGQLELALLNLTVNARAAMPHGGQLTLTTRNVPPGAADLPPELESGAYVVLAVVDTGIGMAPDVLARAMEPFFTTKGIGQGSGLGLSQAYGFSQQLGGTLRLTSQLGTGTCAEIFMPRAG